MRNLMNKVKVTRIAALAIAMFYMIFSDGYKNIMGVLGLTIAATWIIVAGKNHESLNK